MHFNLGLLLVGLPIMLMSISAHECAHGMTAFYYGDPTAMLAGRCTLAPWKHLDLIGGLAVPAITFAICGIPLGWAKQLPVNTDALPTPEHMGLVCAAGPAINLVLAAVLLFALLLVAPTGVVQYWMMFAVKVNLAFAIVNLLPWPGSDGWQIIKALRSSA